MKPLTLDEGEDDDDDGGFYEEDEDDDVDDEDEDEDDEEVETWQVSRELTSRRELPRLTQISQLS